MADNLINSESAVSEVIGNVLIFSIVIGSIGLVLMVGGPVVNNAHDSVKMDYITSTFVILQSNINRVAYNQAPFQNLDLKLGGGSLIQGSDPNITQITVSVNGTNFTLSDYIEYTYKGNHIAYINGGVYKNFKSGSSLMISAPRITVRENMTYVSLYHLSGNVSRGGTGLVRVSMQYNQTRVNKFWPAAGNNLTIELKGQYAGVQGRYLESQGFFKASGNNYTIASESVIISQYYIIISD